MGEMQIGRITQLTERPPVRPSDHDLLCEVWAQYRDEGRDPDTWTDGGCATLGHVAARLREVGSIDEDGRFVGRVGWGCDRPA